MILRLHVSTLELRLSKRYHRWWHTDADLGRQVETFADMGKSRRAGFKDVNVTFDSFTNLFDRLRAEKIIP